MQGVNDDDDEELKIWISNLLKSSNLRSRSRKKDLVQNLEKKLNLNMSRHLSGIEHNMQL